MAAFTINGDWSWVGDTTFTGALSVQGTDIQMEGSVSVRLDAAFGGAGDVRVADSNATHLQLSNTNCDIDVSCIDFIYSGSGAYTQGVTGVVNIQSATEANFHCENGGNSAGVDIFNDGTMTISGTAQILLATLALDLNTVNTNPVNVSQMAGSIHLNAATITAANLPADPGGSVAVMWNAGTQRFYHA